MIDEKRCRGCDGPLHPDEVMNALSRYRDEYICSHCGTREAFEGDFIKKQEENG